MAVSAPASLQIGRLRWRRWNSALQDGLLVAVSTLFLIAHATYAIETGRPASLLFAAEQGLLVGMFLTRRRPVATSQRPADWAVATIGGWLPLALRPDGAGDFATYSGATVQFVGLFMVLVCMGALGKSFGVVAANRGLKVHGPYGIVRHPIYISHFVTQGGFLIANPTSANFAIVAVASIFQLFRIRAEERVLSETSAYADYRDAVRWRLVPGLY